MKRFAAISARLFGVALAVLVTGEVLAYSGARARRRRLERWVRRRAPAS